MFFEPSQASSETEDRSSAAGKERKCSVAGCTTRHYAKEYCKKHYAQVLRHGKLTPERERGAVRVCMSAGCERTDTIRWYCRKHARQIRVHGRLTPEREHVMGLEGCSAPGCRLPHRAKGFCAKHYNQDRWRRIKTDRKSAAKGKAAKARGKGKPTTKKTTKKR